MTFVCAPQGPFDLALANQFFGGWTTAGPDESSLMLSFPVEGWHAAATITLSQQEDGSITGEVVGAGEDAERAWQQALSVLSLDYEATGWPEIAERDPIMGEIQRSYHYLRPVLFHSPYEAAAAFIIGHRISIQQGRKIRQHMAEKLGEQQQIQGKTFSAFPAPQTLLDLTDFQSVPQKKIERLHGVAQAALDGLLDRAYLRSLPVEQALEQLRTLDGIGAFFAQGILMRGAGLVDAMTDDDATKEAIQLAYGLAQRPDQQTIQQIADPWRPYRMWANVLLHVWLSQNH